MIIVVSQVGRTLQLAEIAIPIPEHEIVIAFIVCEVVEDALFFHNPRREIPVALTILDDVVPGVHPNFIEAHRNVESAEHLHEDVGDQPVLEDPAVVSLGQTPHSRAKFGPEELKIVVLARSPDLCDDAGEPALKACVCDQADLGVLPDQAMQLDVAAALGHELNVELKEPGDIFRTMDAPDDQHIVVNSGHLDRNWPFGLHQI
jgi:hypothetical protein